MNINSISSSQAFQTSSNNTSIALTQEQKTVIEDVLSKYDSDSLLQSDALAIVESFKEAGIRPTKGLASTMASYGFDAQEVGSLAGAPRPSGPPPPPLPKEEEISTIFDLLDSLLNTDEKESDTLFDTVFDYTSKILSLKDDAKDEVIDILHNYNSENNELSQEDTQKYIINSLSQIFSESDNFNVRSFYA